jgi:4-hydroxythreonine-4-phosphate dehydrogenase
MDDAPAPASTRARAGKARAPLALSMGDPCGIGPELALMAWRDRRPGGAPFFVLADPGHMARLAEALAFDVPVEACAPDEARAVFARALPIVPLRARIDGRPGAPTLGDAQGAIEAIERGAELVHAGAAGALVTNPISKDSLYKAGFRHPGHTEFLGELAQRHWGVASLPVMMLWSPLLAVVPVTIHVSLRQALAELTRDKIVETGLIAAGDLKRRFGVAAPRLAIAGLNPHAGENGAMGTEERDYIAAAVEDLRRAGVDARGPLPPDTMFHAEARARYDAAICMYHDQALIPIKTLAFDSAVNVTLGLPFVRTSPDHGTAYDIAGKGVASPASLVAALDLATRLTRAKAGAS